jgi:hypothetical protein
VVLGTAKIMSYEDIEETRVKRAVKETAKEAREAEVDITKKETEEATVNKGKRGRKRESAPLESDMAVPDGQVALVAWMIQDRFIRKVCGRFGSYECIM